MSRENNVFISKGCRIRGKLELDGKAVIEGHIEGDIISYGELVVGENGVVDARITSQTASIYGRTVGDIVCGDKLVLHSTAKVYGNLRAPRILIEDGASFEGNCEMEPPCSQIVSEKDLELVEPKPLRRANG